ncbi:MAG: hypothetical protein FDX18_09380 [Chlorobium sp.]|nr:MAG: hypothetical protein FDX18_09380 [Chlorobium sp.]
MKHKFFLFLMALPLLFAGCGHHEAEQAGSVKLETPIVVASIVPVRSVVEAGGGEVLLVPKSAIFRKGELAGVFVVGSDNRLTVRWIRTGRPVNGDLVVLAGLDKGESVVGVQNVVLNEGVTVKKSQRVTEEVQQQ